MSWMVLFGLLAIAGVVTIVASVLEYGPRDKKKVHNCTRATSTTMTSGRTGYVIITYEKER